MLRFNNDDEWTLSQVQAVRLCCGKSLEICREAANMISKQYSTSEMGWPSKMKFGRKNNNPSSYKIHHFTQDTGTT
jgi:hypothetical protein